MRPGGDLDSGFRAEIHDALWFLARQWQLGEHQGEDAASPIGVRYAASHTPIDPYDDDPAMDPGRDPARGDRRVRARRLVDAGTPVANRSGCGASPAEPLPDADDAALRFSDLAPPYDRCNGSYDGLACYRARQSLGLGDELVHGACRPPSPPTCGIRRSWPTTARFTAAGGTTR